MAEFLQNVDVVDHVQKNEEKMIADEADPGHQSDEDIALFQDPLPQEDTEGKYILICSWIQFYTGRTTYRISFCVNLSLFVFNGGKLEILSKTYHSTDKNEDGA